MKICANMVIRNEADKYLPQVLERVVNQVDILCVTDDHSDDNSGEIAKSFGAHVHRTPAPMFRLNEGSLRQLSWNHLSRVIGEPQEPWFVLAIDADEELYETGQSMSDLLDENYEQYDVFSIQFFHMWNENQFRVDGGWRPHGSQRLFRYKLGGQFFQRALACGSEPTYIFESLRNGRFLTDTGLVMKHLSYIKDADKQLKYERYMALDGGQFHANKHIQSIIDPIDQVSLASWDELINNSIQT